MKELKVVKMLQEIAIRLDPFDNKIELALLDGVFAELAELTQKIDMTKEEAIKNIPIGSIWQDKITKETIEITSIMEDSYMGGGYLPYQIINYILIRYKTDRCTDQRQLDIFLRQFEKQSDNYTLKTELTEFTQEKSCEGCESWRRVEMGEELQNFGYCTCKVSNIPRTEGITQSDFYCKYYTPIGVEV